jgi:hypothetical protein
MKRKQPNTRAMLSAQPLGSARDDLSPDELAEEWLNEALSEIATAEDSDPFLAGHEIQIALYRARLAHELAERNKPKSKSPGAQSVKREFWALYRRKKGIVGIRDFLAERFQECNQLLQRLPKLQQLRQIELQRKSKTRRDSAKIKLGSDRKHSSDSTNDDAPIDARPILRLKKVLEQLDECLEMLESDSAKSASASATGPDYTASFGLGLAFGLELGFTAARMLYRSELARAVSAAKHHKQTGLVSKPRWQSQHPKAAKRLVKDVLKSVLINNARWNVAYKTAGVERKIDRPKSHDTVRRIVLREIDLLLREYEEAIRESSGSVKEVCTLIADARKKQGFELSSQLLERLFERDRAGKLPGRTRNWLDSLCEGKVSKELQAELREIDQNLKQSIGDVIGLAIASYEED